MNFLPFAVKACIAVISLLIVVVGVWDLMMLALGQRQSTVSYALFCLNLQSAWLLAAITQALWWHVFVAEYFYGGR